MKIVFLYTKGRIDRLEEFKKGKAASEFFYGAIELQKRGHQVEFYDIENTPRPSLPQKAVDFFSKMQLLPSRVNGSLLVEIYNLCKQFNKKDVIVATTIGISMATALLKTMRLISPPVFAIFLGLLNESHPWLKKKINGIILRRIWTQLFGEAEYHGMCHYFSIPEERISINQFGVDLNFWKPGNEMDKGYILSIGNDFRRDYDLLLETAYRVNYPFKIVTARFIKGPVPSNVTIIPGTWPSDPSIDCHLREWYQEATCIVLPIKESIQPSGQTVALQAMACGKAIVLTKTKGLWSKEMIRHDENVLLVPPANGNALFEAINSLLLNPEKRKKIGDKARETMLREGDIEYFADRLEGSCQKALPTFQG